MAIKRIESSRNNLAFGTLAHSPADEDAGKSVSRYRYTEREIALMKLARKLGMTENDIESYLGIRRRTVYEVAPKDGE
jgi:DNA-binding NarL/FixJ family response regulator